MGAKFVVRYDRQGDILFIDLCAPYPDQETEELGDDVFARRNPKTRAIENLEVLFFSARLLKENVFDIPVFAEMRPFVKPG